MGQKSIRGSKRGYILARDLKNTHMLHAKHVAVDIGDGLILDIGSETNQNRARITDFDTFAQGEDVYVMWEPRTAEDHKKMDDLCAKIKSGEFCYDIVYNFLLNNCEHNVIKWTNYSPLITQTGLATIIVTVVMIAYIAHDDNGNVVVKITVHVTMAMFLFDVANWIQYKVFCIGIIYANK